MQCYIFRLTVITPSKHKDAFLIQKTPYCKIPFSFLRNVCTQPEISITSWIYNIIKLKINIADTLLNHQFVLQVSLSCAMSKGLFLGGLYHEMKEHKLKNICFCHRC